MESYVSPDTDAKFASVNISGIEPYVRSPLRDTTNQFINGGNIYKKPEATDLSPKTPIPADNNTFTIQESTGADIFESSTPKKGQDCDTESDTTADYESAGESSPWKEKSANLSALAESLAGFHLSTPKKAYSKLNHFPYSPISAEDEDEEVISITSNNSQKSPLLNSSHGSPRLQVESHRNATNLELFKAVPESQIAGLPNSLNEVVKDCNEAKVISPVVEFEDAGPACSYHSGIMNSIVMLNNSVSNNSLIEECKHSKTCEDFDNRESYLNFSPLCEVSKDLRKGTNLESDVDVQSSINNLASNVVSTDIEEINPQNSDIPIKNAMISSPPNDSVQYRNTMNLTTGIISPEEHSFEKYVEDSKLQNSTNISSSFDELHNLKEQADCSKQDSSSTIVTSDEYNNKITGDFRSMNSSSILAPALPLSPENDQDKNSELMEDKLSTPSSKNELDGSLDVDSTDHKCVDNAGSDQVSSVVNDEDCASINISVAPSEQSCSIKNEQNKTNLNCSTKYALSNDSYSDNNNQNCTDMNVNCTVFSSEDSSNSKFSQDLNNALTNEILELGNVEPLNCISESIPMLINTEELKVSNSLINQNTSFHMPSCGTTESMDADSNLSNDNSSSEPNEHFNQSNAPAAEGVIVDRFVAGEKKENKASVELPPSPMKNLADSSPVKKSIQENNLNSFAPHNDQLCPTDGHTSAIETNIISNEEECKKINENESEVPLSNLDVEMSHETFIKDLNRNSPILSESVLRIAIEKHPVCFEGNSNDAPDSSLNLTTGEVENAISNANASLPNDVEKNCNGEISIIEMCNLIETTFNNSLNEKSNTDDLGKKLTSENDVISSITKSSGTPNKNGSTSPLVFSDSGEKSVTYETKQDITSVSIAAGDTVLSQEFPPETKQKLSVHNNISAQTKHLILEQESPNGIRSISITPKNISEETIIQLSPNIPEPKEQSTLDKSLENNINYSENLENFPTVGLTSSDVIKTQIHLDLTNSDTHILENTLSGNVNPVINDKSKSNKLTDKSSEFKSIIQNSNLLCENTEIPKDDFNFVEDKEEISAYDSPEIPKAPNNSIASPLEDDNHFQPYNYTEGAYQKEELKTEETLNTNLIQSSPSDILKKNQRNELTKLINIDNVSSILNFDNGASEDKDINLKEKPQLSQKLSKSPKNKVEERILEYPSSQEVTEMPLWIKPDDNKDESNNVLKAKDMTDISAFPHGIVPLQSTDFCINKQIASPIQEKNASSAENEMENDEIEKKASVVKQTSECKSIPTSPLILNKGNIKAEQESISSINHLKSLQITDAGNVNVVCSTDLVKPTDAIKSTALIASYEDLLDICSEQERLLGFDDSIKVEAEKVVKELQCSPTKDSIALLQAPCNVSASSRTKNSTSLCTHEEEENKDTFQDAVNFDFEYLLKIKSKPSFRQKTRESLFLKFDPLATATITPETSTPVENKMVLPDSSSDVASPRSMNSEDLLISLTPNPKTIKEEPSSSPSSNLNVTPKTRHRPASGSVTPTLKNEILSREISKLNDLMIKQELAYQEQIAQYVEEIEELRKIVHEFDEQQPLDELQESLSAAKAKAKSLQEENHKLTLEKTELKRVIIEYDETCKFLIKKNDDEKKELEEKMKKISQDRDVSNKHLETLEIAFNDIHQKYEKCKQVIELFKFNEEEFKKALEENKKSLVEQQDQFIKLKSQASKKIADANIEILEMKKVHNVELAKLEAVNRKNQMQIKTLEETLEQKNREVAELTKICDELIKVSSSSVHY